MATGIPLPGQAGDSFNKGVDTGSSMFARLMQPIIQRENMAREWQQHLNELEIQKQQQGRLGAMLPYQIQAMQDAHAQSQYQRDPVAQFEMLKKIMGVDQSSSQMQENQPYQEPYQSQMQEMDDFGMPATKGINQQAAFQDLSQGNPQPMRSPDMSALQKAFVKKFTGIDVDAETPNQKRFADLQAKIELENRKTENKAQALRDKEVVAVKKDLPTLEKSLKGVDQLIDIAKNNPDLFGHGFMPERFAKVTKNKNFGTWQNLISDAIAGLEQKLSSKGNIVALKMAAQLKPSHGEQQEVAIGKLESMKQQLLDSIDHSKEIVGEKKISNNEPVIDFSRLSDEELHRIIAGGQ